MRTYIFCLVLILLTGQAVLSQNKQVPPYKTPNTHLEPTPDPKSDRPKRRQLQYIIKKDTKRFLPGNRCFEEVTKEMGFLYMAVPKGQSYYTSEFDRNLHNLGAKTLVLLKNGIFWKLKIRKTYKKCKYGYADYSAP